MRTKWVLGNWKQNHGVARAAEVAAAMAAGLDEALGAATGVRVGIAPTFVALDRVSAHTGTGDRDLRLLAQNVGTHESGAFTAEVGPAMLAEVGVSAAIIGHSERRKVFGESDELVARRVFSALAGPIEVVLCCGETLEERDAGNHENVVISQLSAALADVSPEHLARVVVAYEPVWAIGTGRTATPEQAGAMHAVIRRWLTETHPAQGPGRSILYGGSVKPGNAAELIAQPDIDGFLVGGASLDADSFLAIVRHAAGRTSA